MKKPRLSFASLVFLATLLLTARTLRADGVMFSVSSAELGPQAASDTADLQSLIGRLKYRAVVNWLQSHLGSRYDRFAPEVTSEFAEKYVLDYRVSRRPGNVVELSGHLDADSLKRWLRVTEAKASGSQAIKPLFILSSDVPGVSFTPKETALRVQDNRFAQAVFTTLNTHFGKFNTRLIPLSGGSLSLTEPPRSPNEIARLKEAGASGGYTGAVWVHVATCKSCSGSRMDTFYFNLAQGRVGLVDSDEIPLQGAAFNAEARARKAIKAPLQQFESDFDDLVSTGTLFSSSYRLVVEGIDSYRAFKAIEGHMGELDFLTKATVKRSEAGTAEFEILSSLRPDEVFQRFGLASLPGFQLKPVRVDSDTIVVRYSR